MVRLRQAVHNVANGLLFVPLVFVLGAVVLAQAMTAIDGRLDDAALPTTLTTSVDGGRSILSAIAGGLISSVTLLLSLVLVAVQLASSQFSPRTLRGWTSNRTQQVAIGLVLGTAVYCLLVLRETRTLSDNRVLVPHLSVLLAVTLGVLSLIAVLRSVDELTNSLRIGSVAQSITDETVDAIHKRADRLLLPRPGQRVAVPPTAEFAAPSPSEELLAIPAPRSGWVQQIDEDRLIGAGPDGSVVRLVAPVGAFVMKDSPLAWVDPIPDGQQARAHCLDRAAGAYAIGDERTLHTDVGYGILQLTDIALRALSPGVNDPNTANDIIVNLGVVLLSIWEYPTESGTREADNRTLIRRLVSHGEFLERAFDPVRRHGADNASVVATMLTTLATLRAETQRRNLPGPIGPIDDTVDRVLTTFRRSDPDPRDVEIVEALAAELFDASAEAAAAETDDA
ncbi:MAG: DUF2254 domain-containing protein [Acidimicrobiia bacterium]|nr:DUF2254 domain-containing protein [Acidimicrobiia bacterium]